MTAPLRVLEDDSGLSAELHADGSVVLIGPDGDVVRLDGVQVQRAGALLMRAHVDRGRLGLLRR